MSVNFSVYAGPAIRIDGPGVTVKWHNGLPPELHDAFAVGEDEGWEEGTPLYLIPNREWSYSREPFGHDRENKPLEVVYGQPLAEVQMFLTEFDANLGALRELLPERATAEVRWVVLPRWS